MNNEDKILEKMKENNGIITTKEVIEMGISSKTITRLVRKNKLRKITKGMYVDKENFNDPYFEKLARCRQGIYSHESAFYLYGLIKEPNVYQITIPSHYNTRIITHDENEFFYLKKNICIYGIEKLETIEKNEVNVYNVDRTICDILHDSKRITENRLNMLFSVYLNYENKNIEKAFEYAKILNVEDKLEYMLKRKGKNV